MNMIPAQMQGKPALLAIIQPNGGVVAAKAGEQAGGGFASLLLTLQAMLGSADTSSSSASLGLPVFAGNDVTSGKPDAEVLEALSNWLQEGAQLPEALLNDPAWLELIVQIQLLMAAPQHMQQEQLGQLVGQLEQLVAGNDTLKSIDSDTLPPALRQLVAVLGERAEARMAALAERTTVQPDGQAQTANRSAGQAADANGFRLDSRESAMSKLEWLAMRSGARLPVAAEAMQAGQAAAAEQAPQTVVQPAANSWARADVAPVGSAQGAPAFVSVRDFAKEMASWMSTRWKASLDGSIQEARISLKPQHLGNVDIRISIHNGQLVAQFVADNATSRDMLESQLGALRASLNSQGIQVEKLEVSQSSYAADAAGSGLAQNRGEQQSSGQQQQQSRPQTASMDGAAAAEESLQAVMNELEQEQAELNGNGRFDASI